MECFTIMSNEIEGPINPERYVNILKFVNQIKIKDIAIVLNELFVPAKKYPNKIFDWLRIDKVGKGGFLFEDSVITTEGKNINKSSVQFAKEGDILIARLGPSLSNEKILIAPKTKNDLVVSGEFIVLRPMKIKPEIILYILKTDKYLKYILSKGRGGTPSRLRIDRDDFLELNFPKIDKKTATKIFNLVNGLKAKIKQKETEAQQLLDSINDYVLSELGIKLPELKDQMTFVVYADDVKGKRIDAYYYQPKFEEIEEAIKKGKFELVKIKDVLEYVKKGIEVGSNAYVSNGVPFIRVADINDYKINVGNADKKINLDLYEKLKENYKPEKNDILFSKDGTIGFCVVVDEEKDYIISSGILRLKTKKEVNKYYLKAVLSNQLFKILFGHESIGAIIKHLTPEKFLNLKIPLPPIKIQNKIAEEVKRRMQKAEQLQKEAKEILERAKQEVEKIILGG